VRGRGCARGGSARVDGVSILGNVRMCACGVCVVAGHDDKVRVVLNKADQVTGQQVRAGDGAVLRHTFYLY
jgi:hypothetical protein